MNTKTWKILMMTALLAMSFALAGCSDDNDDATMTGPDLGDGVMLRVVHGSPDAGLVDVYAEGVAMPLLSSVPYAAVSGYLELDAGTYNIQLRPAGASAGSAPVYETGDVTVADGETYTAVAAGLIGSTDPSTAFRVLLLREDWADPGVGNAAVRIVHTAADAPAVAIDVGNDGSPEIASLDRFADTGAAGVALPAGTPLSVGIWTAEPLNKVTAFSTPALPEGEILLIAVGRLADLPRDETGFGILAVGAEGAIGLIRQDPSVFFLHASPDAPAVDVRVGGTDAVLVDALSFGDLSPAVQVPPASYSLDVVLDAGGALVETVTTPALMAGERYLAVATGFAGDTERGFAVLALKDDFAESMDALVRVVHASPDAPTVDVGVWDGAVFTPVSPLSNLSYGDASTGDGTAIAPGGLTIGLAGVGSASPVATFDLSLTSGLRAFAVAGGSLAERGESFRLLVVDATSFPWQTVQVLPN